MSKKQTINIAKYHRDYLDRYKDEGGRGKARTAIQKEHIARAKQGKGAWNQWAEQVEDAIQEQINARYPDNNASDAQKQAIRNAYKIDFSGIRGEGKGLGGHFKSFKFPITVAFSGTTFSGGANFMDAVFSGEANFADTKFFAKADFVGTKFFAKADFADTKFSGEANFFRVKFSKNADFAKAVFSGLASFTGTKFFDNASFSGAKFFDKASFWATKFFGNVGFNIFNRDILGGATLLKGVVFSKDVIFLNTEFSGDANFFRVKFLDKAHFLGVSFLGKANFCKAEFSGDADFSSKAHSGGVTFSGEADFSGAIFSGRTNFSVSRFIEDAHFIGTRFIGGAGQVITFQTAKFKAGCLFSDIQFGNEALAYPVNFLETRFAEPPLVDNFSSDWERFKEATADEVRKDFYKDHEGQFRRLKKLAEGNNHHLKAIEFYACELYSQSRASSGGCDWRNWANFIYRFFSGYGLSFLKPFRGWLGMILLAFVIQACTDNRTVIKYHPIIDINYEAIGFYIGPSFSPINHIDTKYPSEVRKRLYPANPAKNRAEGQMPALVRIFRFIQSVFSLVMFFLMALALRNRFKIG